MANLRKSLPTCSSESCVVQKKKGGDGEKDSGRFGKDDVATARYTSANYAVHNAGSKRQGKRVEERRINQGNRECSGISKNKNKNVLPKSTSLHNRSSHFEDFSGRTDDKQNGGDGGSNGKGGGGGGGSGSNNKDKGSGGAGFGDYPYGYHCQFALSLSEVQGKVEAQEPKFKEKKFNKKK